MAEEHYGPLAPSTDLPERTRPQEPPQLAERRLSFGDPRIAQPYVVRTYLAPERNSGDQARAAALTVLAEVLGGNPATSVLGRKLQFESQAALHTGTWYDGGALDPTTFTLTVVPAPGLTLQQAEDALDKVIADFLQTGVDPAQLDRIKTQIRAAEIYANDNVDRLARRYGEALTTGLNVQDVQDWPAVLQQVSAEDVMAAARDVFDRRRAVTGWAMRADGGTGAGAGGPATDAALTGTGETK